MSWLRATAENEPVSTTRTNISNAESLSIQASNRMSRRPLCAFFRWNGINLSVLSAIDFEAFGISLSPLKPGALYSATVEPLRRTGGYLFHRVGRRRRTGYGLFQKTPKCGHMPYRHFIESIRRTPLRRIPPG